MPHDLEPLGGATPPAGAPDRPATPALRPGAPSPRAGPDPPPALRVHAEGGRVVVELHGDDPFPEERTACAIREQLYRLVDADLVQLHLDLARVRHASSFLVTTLASLQVRVGRVGGRLVVRNLDPDLQHILRLCNLDSVLETCEEDV